MMMNYGLIWLLLIVFILGMYLILDGFTLGIGLLFPWFKNSQDRHNMLESVLPVWDSNQTWLVFAGAALYAGFPLAFSILLGAYYTQGIALVAGLLLRGVSFEFIHKTNKLTRLWEYMFAVGSLTAVIAQGIIMNSLIYGFTKVDNNYLPNKLLDPTAIVTIIGLIAAYSLLAAAKLGNNNIDEIMNTRLAKICKLLQIITIVIVICALWIFSLDNPLNDIYNNKIIKIVISLMLITSLLYGHKILSEHKFNKQFYNLVFIFLTIYLYYITSLLPFVVPFQLTFQEMQSSNDTLKFMLIGALIFIPLILINTSFNYKLFAKRKNKNENKISY